MYVFLMPQRQLFYSSFLFICFMFISNIALSKTIQHHSGGGVTQVYMDVVRANKNGIRVRIAGRCMSACTLYLVSKKVCVTKEASFMFHQARRSYGLQHRAMPNIKGTQFLMEHYPPQLRDWITMQGGLPWYGWLTLNASTAVKYGIAKYCVDERRENG